MVRSHLLAILLLTVSLALLSACASTPDPSASTATPARPTPTAAPSVAPTVERAVTPAAAAPADVRATIAAAVEMLDQRGPYRMQITSTLDDGVAELLVVPPDRSHFKTSSGGQSVEIISIGATSYMLEPDGLWQTLPSDTGGIDSGRPISAADLADIVAPQALGEQLINGISAVGYSFGSTADPATLSTMWVGPDGAPVRLTATAEGQTTTFDIVYDASITIEPPAP